MNKTASKRRAQPNRSIKLDPALKAALIWVLPSLLLRLAAGAVGFGWIDWLLQLLFYIICGFMAAAGYHETIRKIYPKGRTTESIRSGAKAGITLGILLSACLILLILIGNWLIPVAMLVLAGQLPLILLIPLDILGGLFLGALGGRMFMVVGR